MSESNGDDSEAIRPIEVNAGGIVPPEDLVGREIDIDRLLRLAAPPHHGAILLGDRRIGKTSLLRTVEQPLRDAGHIVVRVSAETSSLDEFGRTLLAGLRMNPHRRSWDVGFEGEVAVDVGVGQIVLRGTARSAAPSVETDLFVAIAEEARVWGGHVRVVFLLDEITFLTAALAKSSPVDAEDFLGTLRRAREEFPEVVMFMAGSIGLHHALPDKTKVNDLREIHVDTLSDADAMKLAQGLIVGAGLAVSDSQQVAAAMVEETSGFPYYLHGVAQALSERAGVVDPETVRCVVQSALDQDLWNSSHYETRLDGYYGSDAELVRDILDAIATTEHPLSVTSLMEGTRVASHNPQRTHLLSLLRRLEADHYLRRSEDANLMANGLVKRIWRHLRRL